MIFTVRKQQKISRKQNRDAYIIFIILKKSFVILCLCDPWKFLGKCECSDKKANIIHQLCDGQAE